mgnify:CR=1 FL=1
MVKKIPVTDRVFSVLNYILLTICAFITLYPFLYVIATSLSSTRAINSGEVYILPIEATLTSYKSLVQDGQILSSMKNTVIITAMGTLLNIMLTILSGYVLSRKRLMIRGGVLKLMIFTMMFNAGIIPNFIFFKNIGVMNSFAAIWLVNLIGVYNVVIMKNFMGNIPESMEEAARIDGANDWIILFRIMIPLSKPVIATLTLFYAVGWWNDYYTSMIYLNDPAKYPMTVKLMQMINNMSESMLKGEGVIEQGAQSTPEGVKAASIVLSTLPILCLYPFLQKYFVKGVMVGSVKG